MEKITVRQSLPALLLFLVAVLAAACGTPTLALYGATDPGGSTPWGPRSLALRLDGIPCAPCFQPQCTVPGHPCLAGLDPDRVWNSLAAFF